MGSIVLVGKNSYLAGQLLDAPIPGRRWHAVSHDEVAQMPLEGVDCIVNFACNPEYRTSAYDPGMDMDRMIVDKIYGTNIHFVMISSRMVYGNGSGLFHNEDQPTEGRGNYGKNKVISEEYVRDKMPSSSTIIRIGNIIENKAGRPTFMGRALETLSRNGRISLDISPFTLRDFLPLDAFCRAMAKIAGMRPTGTYNLGTGLATPVGRVAMWLIEGYGSGEMVALSHSEDDFFVMDVDRLEALIGPICAPDDIRNACVETGRQLLNA